LKRSEGAPLIAQIVAIALLIGSLPIAASSLIPAHDSAPSFTLNVCHPPLSFTIGTASCCLPTLATFSFEREAGYQAVMAEFIPVVAGRAIAAPDPPPPKSLI
jgi:hypothetical protein